MKTGGIRAGALWAVLSLPLAASCGDDDSGHTPGDAGAAGDGGQGESGGGNSGGSAGESGKGGGSQGGSSNGGTSSAGTAGTAAGHAGSGGEAGGDSPGGHSSSGGEAGGPSQPGCSDNQYREVGAPGCRDCSNWEYRPSDESCRIIEEDVTFDAEAHELRLQPGQYLPMPRAWSIGTAEVFAAEGGQVECDAQASVSIRDGQLIADLSSFQACAEQHGGIVVEFGTVTVDYGCAGGGSAQNYTIRVPLGVEGELSTSCGDSPHWPPKRIIPGAPFETVTRAPVECSDEQYQDVNYPVCLPCGNWEYSVFDDSCRVLGKSSHFDREAGELVMDAAPGLPQPISWSVSEWSIAHVDPEQELPDCGATAELTIRDGKLIADVSEFQDCVAEVPAGAILQLVTPSLNYGCAGHVAPWIVIDFALTGEDYGVAVFCETSEDWPPRRFGKNWFPSGDEDF